MNRRKFLFYSCFGAFVGILGGLPPAIFFWYSSKSLALALSFPVVFALSGVLVALYLTWSKLAARPEVAGEQAVEERPDEAE